MQKIQKIKCQVIITIAISLMLLITACATNTKIEYVYDLHNIVFPSFPDPEVVTFDEETGTVRIPLWYWQKVAEYKIDVDAIEAYFKKLQDLQAGAAK